VARCEDFLSVDVNDPEYAEVRAVLLDPSCRYVLYKRFSPIARFQHLIAWVPFN